MEAVETVKEDSQGGRDGSFLEEVLLCVGPGIKDLDMVPETCCDPNSALLASPIPHHPVQFHSASPLPISRSTMPWAWRRSFHL